VHVAEAAGTPPGMKEFGVFIHYISVKLKKRNLTHMRPYSLQNGLSRYLSTGSEVVLLIWLMLAAFC